MTRKRQDTTALLAATVTLMMICIVVIMIAVLASADQTRTPSVTADVCNDEETTDKPAYVLQTDEDDDDDENDIPGDGEDTAFFARYGDLN